MSRHYLRMALQMINSDAPSTRKFWREKHPELARFFKEFPGE